MEPVVLGIIAEYNPMHNGHIHHLAAARAASAADFVVAVMSGDFVQRGRPAVLDKWTRAKLAAEQGIDLVLELPAAYAVNSAEYFARGAMAILKKSRVVTHVGFGYEGEDPALLSEVAQARRSAAYKEALQEVLGQETYARAHHAVLAGILGEEAAETASLPNNILAALYLEEMEDLIPVPIERDTAYAPASWIRQQYTDGKMTLREAPVPYEVAKALEDWDTDVESPLLAIVRSRILTASAEDLSQVFGMTEGLEQRLKKVVREGGDWESLLTAAGTKRYTRAALSRLLIQIAIDMKKDVLGANRGLLPGYGRVLAIGRKGRELIRLWQQDEWALPLITKVDKDTDDPLLQLDMRAADVYNLARGADLYEDSDLVRHPYVMQDE